MARTILIALAVFALLSAAPPASAADRSEREPQLVYDGEFGGYVPIIDGIQRPDLSADEDGRVAATREEALKVYRRKIRQSHRRPAESSHAVPGRTHKRSGVFGRMRQRRWERRVGVRTELLVQGFDGRPVEGARVFRYHDPSFYAYNVGRHGGRMVDAYRLRPFPYPSQRAREVLLAYHDRWLDAGAFPVAAGDADFDLENNPWVRWFRAESLPPLEYVGTTDAGGHLEAVSGVFNLLREDRFPDSTAPRTIRIGYLIVSDGYLLTEVLSRCQGGGLEESRTVTLERAPGHELFVSDAFRAALAAARAAGAVAGDDPDGAATVLDDLLERLVVPAARLPGDEREVALRLARARVLRAAASRAPLSAREGLLVRALEQDPDSAHLHQQLALALAASRGVYPYESAASVEQPDATLQRAESEALEALRLGPDLAPAYALLDRLLERRGAAPAERAGHLERLVERSPFDRWARARLATLSLGKGSGTAAFEHLPFTWAAGTRFGIDLPLARALADYYQRQGLPEKAGYFSFTVAGRVPEDIQTGFPRPEDEAEPP